MKKRILIVSQHFWPENFRITDIAEGFCENEIEVDVLCGLPNYPNGIIEPGYGFFKKTRQCHNNINIYRAWEIPRSGNSSIKIFLNYISFPFFATFRLFSLLNKSYDAIFCYETSPVYMIFPAIVFSKIKKIKLTTYVLDLWPENLYSVLNLKSNFLRNICKATSHWHYKNSHKLIAMSPSLNDKLLEITKKNSVDIITIPQYCEAFYETCCEDSQLSNIYKDFFKIVYAGNISPAQNLEILADAAVLLKRDKLFDIKFIIVGDGMSKSDIIKYIEKQDVLEYFDFIGSKKPTEIPIYHTLADCLVAPLAKSPLIGLTIPAKITSYMAARRPIITAIDGEGSWVIKKANAGLIGESGDFQKLYENIKALYNMPLSARKTLGENGFSYHSTYHSRDKVLKNLIEFILS